MTARNFAFFFAYYAQAVLVFAWLEARLNGRNINAVSFCLVLAAHITSLVSFATVIGRQP